MPAPAKPRIENKAKILSALDLVFGLAVLWGSKTNQRERQILKPHNPNGALACG